MTTYTVTYGPFGEPPTQTTVHNVHAVTFIPQFRTAQLHDADGELIGAISHVQSVARADAEKGHPEGHLSVKVHMSESVARGVADGRFSPVHLASRLLVDACRQALDGRES